MTRRALTTLLHWANMLLVILLVAAGPAPVLAWLFVLTAGAMVGLAIARGLMNGPGPKLEGFVRAAHPWLSWGMYAALGLTGLATMLDLIGVWTPAVSLQQLYFVLLSMASLHGVFHLWRHTALGDGALKRITPKALHGLL